MRVSDARFYICDDCGKPPDLQSSWNSFAGKYRQIDFCEECMKRQQQKNVGQVASGPYPSFAGSNEEK